MNTGRSNLKLRLWKKLQRMCEHVTLNHNSGFPFVGRGERELRLGWIFYGKRNIGFVLQPDLIFFNPSLRLLCLAPSGKCNNYS
jgi:hypothetical protein